ncbi:MAG: DUF3187 family protein [Proteobacteria bacterium]|nr:DUF3187 family protein [Pseudomonadota bacterium]
MIHFCKLRVVRLVALVIAASAPVVYPTIGQASERPLAVRSLSPFTQIFGLPFYPDQTGPAQGEWALSAGLDLVNHADLSEKDGEAIELDGESYVLNLGAKLGLSPRWRVGLELPIIHHGGGFMDAAIEGWHDLLGLSNSDREGPRDELLFSYTENGEVVYLLDDSTTGIGDIRVWSSYTLVESGPSRVSLRATLKLPTGDADDLTGSGGTDLAFDVAASHSFALDKSRLLVSAYAGLLVLGDGDVIERRQEDLVPYGGVGAVWELNPHWDLLAQLQMQGAYFDSRLDELGGSGTQLSVGVRYMWPSSGTELVVSLVEDLVSDTTPDFTVGFELRKLLR